MLPRSTALLFVLWFGLSVLLIHSLDNRLGHVVDHLVGHAGVNADPEGVVHDKVSVGQLPCHAVGVGAADQKKEIKLLRDKKNFVNISLNQVG